MSCRWASAATDYQSQPVFVLTPSPTVTRPSHPGLSCVSEDTKHVVHQGSGISEIPQPRVAGRALYFPRIALDFVREDRKITRRVLVAIKILASSSSLTSAILLLLLGLLDLLLSRGYVPVYMYLNLTRM